MAALRTVIALGFFLLLASGAFAQGTHRGRLTDRESQESIAGASVDTRAEVGDSTWHHHVSDLRGLFRYSEGSAQFRIHALGYRDTLVRLAAPVDSIEIVLQRDDRQVPVVVTAVRRAIAEQDVPISTVTISSTEVQKHNPQGLDNVLRYVPGVTMTEDQLSIRGSTGYSRSVGARVLLLLDGAPFLSADNADMKFDALPLMSVDHVEVVKGAGSALYGSSALGGVVNVITRQAEPLSTGAISIYGGYYEIPNHTEWEVPSLDRRFYSVEGGWSGQAAGLGIVGSASYKRNESYRVGDDNKRWNAFAKLTRKLDNGDLTLSLLGASEDHGGWTYWRSLSQPLIPADSLSAVNGRIHSQKQDVALSYKSIFSPSSILNLRANVFRTAYTTDQKFVGDTATPHSSAIASNAEGTFTWFSAEDLVLTSGLDMAHQSVSSDLYDERSSNAIAAFTQAEIHPLTDLIVTPGVRWDLIAYKDVASENQLSPKVGLSYKLRDDLSLRASYGFGFRAPSIGERFIHGTLSGIQVHPNLDLKSEKSTSTELGVQYNTESLTLDAAAFYSQYKDLIEPGFVQDPAHGTAYVQFRNVTQAAISGHEESITYRPLGDLLSITGAYTYIYPENRDLHTVLQFRPRHNLQLEGELRFGHATAGVDYRYISAYESLDSVLSQQITDGGERIGVRVLDLRLGYTTEFLVPMTITLQAQNVLNYNYVEISGNLAPPRSYALRLDTRF